MINFSEIKYGFKWGAAEVTRLFSNPARPGSVTLGIDTDKVQLQVYVTKTGKVRIHDRRGREWKPEGAREVADGR